MCSSDTVCVWQDANTIDEAVKQLQDSGCTQPVLFRFQQMFWVKADNTAVAAHFDCITDAFEFLFQLFFYNECAVSTGTLAGLRFLRESSGCERRGWEKCQTSRILSAGIAGCAVILPVWHCLCLCLRYSSVLNVVLNPVQKPYTNHNSGG